MPVRYSSCNTKDASCHCEEWNDEAISAVRDCFGLDALAMTIVGIVLFFWRISMRNHIGH
jgi:hypothetical protein